MCKRIVVPVVLCLAIGLGTLAVPAAPGGEPGRPCYVDPNLQCLNYVDPVRCVKPGEGWKVYSNACYAMKDCALSWTCVRTGT